MNTKFENYLLDSVKYDDFDFNVLHSSMFYTLEAGGKRFRPNLLFACAKSYGLCEEDVYDVACAIELLHTYTLVHDDLPAMDDDDLRRGKSSNHLVYGEDMAILAGDALQAVANKYIYKALEKGYDIKLAEYFSNIALQVVQGQSIDIDESFKVDVKALKKIHKYKTGALIEFCVVAPLFLTKDFSNFDVLKGIGNDLGVAFQIKDDILDYESSSEVLGKSASDLDNNKGTYVSMLGIEKSKIMLEECLDNIKNILIKLNLYTNELSEIIRVSSARKK